VGSSLCVTRIRAKSKTTAEIRTVQVIVRTKNAPIWEMRATVFTVLQTVVTNAIQTLTKLLVVLFATAMTTMVMISALVFVKTIRATVYRMCVTVLAARATTINAMQTLRK
jgi:hypothetical protein